MNKSNCPKLDRIESMTESINKGNFISPSDYEALKEFQNIAYEGKASCTFPDCNCNLPTVDMQYQEAIREVFHAGDVFDSSIPDITNAAWKAKELFILRDLRVKPNPYSDLAKYYFEAHITVDAGENWEHFIDTVPSSYRCSKFDEDQVDNYHGKWFCSARGTSLEDFKNDLSDTINTLTEKGYNVIRWKIEDTLLDSKHGDVLN